MHVTVWDRVVRSLFRFHPMKLFAFTTLAVLTFLVVTPNAIALFGHVAAERDRRQHAEQQVVQEQQTNGHLYVALSVLSAGIVVALVVGAAVGSKAKEHHEA